MAGRNACTRDSTVGGAMDHRGCTEAVGWVVRSVGGSTGPGEGSCPMLGGAGIVELLEGVVVFSRSRRMPGGG